MNTSMGSIGIQLYPKKAPITTANFIQYVNASFYEGLIFHRVIDNFVIQGGGFYPNMTQKPPIYPAIPLEINDSLLHVDGAIAMARASDPDSATCQFYICDGPQPHLDGSYAVFGKVISGMDVVRAIASVPTQSEGPYTNVPVEDVIIYDIEYFPGQDSVDENEDAFPEDPTQSQDTDDDGYGDNQSGNNPDMFPNDSTQWNDTDGDGYGDNQTGDYPDHMPDTWGNSTLDYYGCPDDDGDGWSNLTDAFISDSTQWNDTDGDGYGDNDTGTNPDAFISDSTQWNDTDGDGYGDNQSGNNPDAFPNDTTQWNDTDGDGYGDNQSGNNPDAFPNDTTQWNDTDGDGYGDNAFGNEPDAFPEDSTEWSDNDNDSIGDNSDEDDDNDDMPDEWEIEHGLNATDPTDAAKDADGDGVSNKDEYESDSDPLDAKSRPGFVYNYWWSFIVIGAILIFIVVLIIRRKKIDSQ
jgi:cyclophilin family peptidyl-prolyl cis-trans isomerase